MVVAGLAVTTTTVGGQSPLPSQAPHALLDVPYFTQTPELCGGAAVAMVLRYWGDRGVFPQDFQPLVNTNEGGILTNVLAGAVRDRGWETFVAASSQTDIQTQVDRGRPVVALLDVGGSVYHFVVIVGVTDRIVVVHDPARAPFRVLSWAEFDRGWTATGRWMMVVLPRPGGPPASLSTPAPGAAPAAAADLSASTACSALVARGIETSLAGDRATSAEALSAATVLCPSDPAGWRELAGLRFIASDWREANRLARRATALAPDDTYSWQLAGASAYLLGDTANALEAWNQADEPRIDALAIQGADRTRQPVIADRSGLVPGNLLTANAFARSLRRLRDLPVAAAAAVRYEPLDGGRARVDLVVDERPLAPAGLRQWAVTGGIAAVRREARVDLAGPLGAGELWSGMARWAAHRPRVELSLAMPAPRRWPGIATITGWWEHQSYVGSGANADQPFMAARRGVSANLAEWATARLRWEGGAAFERFDHTHTINLNGALDVRAAGDRLSIGAGAGAWSPIRGDQRFGSAEVSLAWRSSADTASAFWSGSATLAAVTGAAPLAVWPGAGTGGGRPWLLRAHPLLRRGVLGGPAFGRQLAHTTVEYQRPLGGRFAGMVALAGFLDGARASHRMAGLPASPLLIDAGFGVRLRLPGGGAIRVDAARGVRDGRQQLSAGWTRKWPR